MPKSNAEYKQIERKKKRKAGLVPYQKWIRPVWKGSLDRLIKILEEEK